jgi:sec-independent protein translocase protein TatB
MQPPIEVANLGMWDTLLLMVLALVVFGPRKLPQLGRQIGKLMYEFRKASNDFKFQMEEELRQSEEADRRKKEEAERQKALAATPPAPQLEQSAATSSDPAAQLPAEPTAAPSAPEISDSGTFPGSDANEVTERSDIATAPASETQPEPPAPSAAEEATPRIKPPSTGEIVAAERPGSHPPADTLTAGPPAANDNLSGAHEPANDAHRSEPAARHG